MKSSVIVFCFFNFLVLVRPAIVNKTTGHEKHQEGTRVGDITNSPRQNNLQSGNGVERSRRTLILKDENRLWPNGIIPYSIDIKICQGKQTQNKQCQLYKEILKKGMAEWEKSTCIKFKESNATSRVSITTSNRGCHTLVTGRTLAMRVQVLNLGFGCWRHPIILHELGHVIGLWHEQNRFDRDNYVTIDTKNIVDDMIYDYQKKDNYEAATNGLPYDYHSIMHYEKGTFSKDPNKDVIKTKDPAMQDVIGTAVHLSALDIKTVNLAYKCAGCLNGGTLDGKTFTCRCLDNFHGVICENCRNPVPHMEKCANRWDFIIYATQKVTPASTL